MICSSVPVCKYVPGIYLVCRTDPTQDGWHCATMYCCRWCRLYDSHSAAWAISKSYQIPDTSTWYRSGMILPREIHYYYVDNEARVGDLSDVCFLRYRDATRSISDPTDNQPVTATALVARRSVAYIIFLRRIPGASRSFHKQFPIPKHLPKPHIPPETHRPAESYQVYGFIST